MQFHGTHLTDLEQAIVAQVTRYQLTVPKAVANRCLPPPHDVDFAQGLLGRLRRLGVLGQSSLYGQSPCYWLTDEAIKSQILGNDFQHKYAGPMAEATKFRAFGMLTFCCCGNTVRELLTRDELAQALPSLIRPGLSSSFYREAALTGRLGFARVDLNGTGRWDRIVQKVAQDGTRLWKDGSVRSRIANDEFELALITATARKAKHIETAWAELTHLRSIPIRVVAIPELIQLVGVPMSQSPWSFNSVRARAVRAT